MSRGIFELTHVAEDGEFIETDKNRHGRLVSSPAPWLEEQVDENAQPPAAFPHAVCGEAKIYSQAFARALKSRKSKSWRDKTPLIAR